MNKIQSLAAMSMALGLGVDPFLKNPKKQDNCPVCRSDRQRRIITDTCFYCKRGMDKSNGKT